MWRRWRPEAFELRAERRAAVKATAARRASPGPVGLALTAAARPACWAFRTRLRRACPARLGQSETTGWGRGTTTNERSSWRNKGGVPLHYRPAKVEDHTPLSRGRSNDHDPVEPRAAGFGHRTLTCPKARRPPDVKPRRAGSTRRAARRGLTSGPTVCSQFLRPRPARRSAATAPQAPHPKPQSTP